MAIVRNYYKPDCSKQINVFFRVLEPRNLIKSRPFHFHQKALRESLLVLLLDSSGLLVCLTWLVDIDPSLHSSLLEILLFVYLCIIFLRYQSLSLGLTPINQWHFKKASFQMTCREWGLQHLLSAYQWSRKELSRNKVGHSSMAKDWVQREPYSGWLRYNYGEEESKKSWILFSESHTGEWALLVGEMIGLSFKRLGHC